MLKEILRRGYFPRELPSPFYTTEYANVLSSLVESLSSPFSYGVKGPKYSSRGFQYNVARRGRLRRQLTVPNPINFFHAADLISNNWIDIQSHFFSSNQTLSRPTYFKKDRALNWERGFKELPKAKLKIRNFSKFIVKADISGFYPSIYTHSIPWALHTKPVAKTHRAFRDNIGNKIDQIIRNGQDGQTKGIPIGPDSSLVFSEIITTAIDNQLISHLNDNYIRYIDDYEFGCKTINDAENVIATLQEIVAEYELMLNTSKTKIIELPYEIGPLWRYELKNFNFRKGKKSQRSDLLHFYDLSIDLYKKNDNEPVIKYAIKTTSSLDLVDSNWDIYEDILLQWAIIEPGVLPITIDFLKHYASHGYRIDLDKVKKTLEFIIINHAQIGHTSELAWSVWGMILFQLNFDNKTVDVLSRIDNPVIALLCLDAQKQSLIDATYTFVLWSSLMNESELKEKNWLLAYEANIKSWLPSIGGDYVSRSEGFSLLKKNNVNFYNASRTFSYKPHVKYWSFKPAEIYSSTGYS